MRLARNHLNEPNVACALWAAMCHSLRRCVSDARHPLGVWAPTASILEISRRQALGPAGNCT